MAQGGYDFHQFRVLPVLVWTVAVGPDPPSHLVFLNIFQMRITSQSKTHFWTPITLPRGRRGVGGQMCVTSQSKTHPPTLPRFRGI